MASGSPPWGRQAKDSAVGITRKARKHGLWTTASRTRCSAAPLREVLKFALLEGFLWEYGQKGEV